MTRTGCSTSAARSTASVLAASPERSPRRHASPATRTSVVGADVSWRPRASDRVTAFVLQSWSDRRGDRDAGVAMQANYFSNSKRLTLGGQIEHYDRGFAMDTAFYNRVGFTSGWGYAEYSFYPDKTRYPWLRRVSPFVFVSGGRDRMQQGDERLAVFGRPLPVHAAGILPRRSHPRPGAVGRPRVRDQPLARERAKCSCNAGSASMPDGTPAARSSTIASRRSRAARARFPRAPRFSRLAGSASRSTTRASPSTARTRVRACTPSTS